MELHYIHVITVSDGYAMCDCLSQNDFNILTNNENLENALRNCGAFIIMIKSLNLKKGKYYCVNLEIKEQSFIKSVSYDFIDEDNIAYTFDNNKIIIFNYEVVTNINKNLNEVLYEYTLLKIKGHLLNDNFLGDDAEYLLNLFVNYNAGAALCSAILDRDRKPFFFYDMGCTISGLHGDIGKRFNVDISHAKWLCISHRHCDHFNFFLRKYKQMQDIHLIINENFISNHSIVINKILLQSADKGNLYYLKEDVIQHTQIGDISLLSRTQNQSEYIMENNAHENNICMIIENKQKVFMCGDNYYDAFESEVLENIDVLCATHHGGAFYKERKDVIPKNKNNGILIVNTSGQHNGHPSELEAYRNAGWNNIQLTVDGDIQTVF